ncbi:MAG TPA: NAD(P)/FAD-dependent oxidoreductase [Tepidisphaeraceae bacterium]|nr:NAD(P)/FAD-dependent oxidoreductase [Tepidisphaeraceae bacterium]
MTTTDPIADAPRAPAAGGAPAAAGTIVQRPRIVILGGGFGGVYTALHLERTLRPAEADIILISRDNYFLISPLLFEAGSGVLEPRHAVNPMRTMFRRTHFVQAEILGIDLEGRKVHVRVEGGDPYDLDYSQLVLALGGVTNTRLIPGSESAKTFKTLGDAMHLRNHVIQRFESADVERDPARKRRDLTFVLVGAGFVGVELIGEMTEFIPNVARAYKNVRPSEIRYELIEAGPRVAPEFDEPISKYIDKVLRQRGVNIRTSTFVDRIDGSHVYLRGGGGGGGGGGGDGSGDGGGGSAEPIESNTIIVAAGVAPSPLVAQLPVERTPRGAVVVEPTMRVKDRPELWALGDNASIPSPSGRPYPALAQHALREAKVLAGNIARTIRGRGDLQPFVYETMGLLAALGHYRGVGRIGKVRIYGFIAWWVWRSYYLMQMPQWSRRIRILIDWTVALLFSNDVVQLDPVREADARRLHEMKPAAAAAAGATGAAASPSTAEAPPTLTARSPGI